MYRKHMMEKEEAIAEEMFLTRVGELPVVTSALGQVKDMYTWTKERNGLLKYTLEAGEGAVCSVSGKALPVVSSKLQGSVHMANMVACAQLDRIEKSFPIITKPTEEVLAESKVVYDRTLKPTVDRVVGATTAVANTATGVKDYTVNTVTGVKDYTVNTVTGVKDYTVNTVTGVKDYTVNTVVGVKDRAVSTATGVKDYGVSSVNAALETSYGQKVLTSVDQVLNLGDQYVDRFLVEPEEDMADGGAMVDVKEGGAVNAASTMTKAANLTSKVRRRMYSRAVKDLQHVKKRSLETVDKLNFTVDLIQYAKENIDGVKERVNERLSTATSKVGEVWTEINKEEEEAKEENKENGYEARAIGVARRLTNQLKRNLRSISSTASSLPSGVQDSVAKARSFSEDLYHSFTSVSKFDELPRLMLDQTRDKLAFIGGLLSQISDQALSSRAVGWVVEPLSPIEGMEFDFDWSPDEEARPARNNIHYVPCLPPDDDVEK